MLPANGKLFDIDRYWENIQILNFTEIPVVEDDLFVTDRRTD
jgi:hypothetical protein